MLTLAIGSHLRHGCILHHSCRSCRPGHHGTGVGSTREGTTRPHGVLLVIHHLLLRLIGTRTRLHLGSRSRRGTTEWLSCGIAVTIRSRVHGSRVLTSVRGHTGSRREGSKSGLGGAGR